MGADNNISGRVALVLNDRKLAINIGSEAGVSRGMKFSIRPEKILEIVDPDTKEILDAIELETTRVKATKVYRRMTICETYRTIPLVELESFRGHANYVHLNDRAIQIEDDEYQSASQSIAAAMENERRQRVILGISEK